MNQNQHDELAQLFARHMQVSSAAQQQQQQQQTQPFQQPTAIEHVPSSPDPEKQSEQPIHYISSHYTGTAHIRPDTTSEPSRSPPPPYHEALMPEAMAETLRQHSIDPYALLPNQVHLFTNADNEQRLRLLELWRIAPPSYPLEDHVHGTWISTSVQREEELARARYEQQQIQASRRFPPEEHMLDTTIAEEPISPIREPGETAWPPAARMRAASIAGSRSLTRHGEAEPYIVSGYQADQSAKALDPVYAAAAGLWHTPSYVQAVEQQQHQSAMEDQYGMYEQIRNHADWERMNEQIARERFSQVNGPADEDMVM